MSVQGEVSRVLLNFDGSFDSVQTLAHELGHAYHNTNLGHRTPLQRQTPMALAETASIFCETIMVQAGLAAAGDDDGARLAILDGDLAGRHPGGGRHPLSRFLFERALTAERERGVLSAERLSELMTEAQHEAYRDGLDHDHLHPYMWAVKGHYFTAYYNWPYTFGLLFGIGLYAAVPARPRPVPARLRRPAVGHRAGRGRRAGGPLRHRRPLGRLLDRQPRRPPRPHRRLRPPGRP